MNYKIEFSYCTKMTYAKEKEILGKFNDSTIEIESELSIEEFTADMDQVVLLVKEKFIETVSLPEHTLVSEVYVSSIKEL